MSNKIMAHMVAFYPNREASLEIARALIDGGCVYLEIQFPFSDPTADGFYIQRACAKALEEGFKVPLGFEVIAKIREFSDIPIFIMGYANTLFFHGVEKFLDQCKLTGVQGVIVPDLPLDYDEGLFCLGDKTGMKVIPVIAPSTEENRLKLILSGQSEFVYTALRKGFTGSFTEIGAENIMFLKNVGTFGKKILAGFGISERHQIEAISRYVHACVVGSAFIKEIMNNRKENLYDVILRKMKALMIS